MRRAYVNIGSNIGDRHALVGRAVALVSSLDEGSGALVSGAYESEPWGYESPHRFINVGVSLLTSASPLELLHRLQEMERGISPHSHRNPDGSYADRMIDIDLIAMEGVEMESAELTLPHPRAAQRAFVMQPLIETLLEVTP